jgi:hypothetical protein
MILAGAASPAGGAELGQVAIATAGGMLATAVLLVLVAGHRTGRLTVFSRLAVVAERATGMRGWAALPGAVLIVALSIAVFGMYWDISIHIDNGRDPGPLANPAHYFILAGLFGVLFAGVMSIALPLRGAGHAEVTLPNRWRAPVGGLLITACGAFSLVAFPLDDIWHRLFGQDVTLWGPTHLMLIGGAGLSVLGAWVLHVEGLGGGLTREVEGTTRWTTVREGVLAGALLIGLSTFQAEFDFAVPQFRLVMHPILLMLAAGVVLVAARIRLGRGGALVAVVNFLVLRAILAMLVGPVIGNTTPHFPLYIASAVAVELIGLRFAVRERPLAFGALAGIGIGTLGLAGEWGWTHVWFVYPWPGAMLGEAVALGLVMAVAAGVLGGFVGRTLTPSVPRPAAPRWAVPLAAATSLGVVAFALPMTTPSDPIRASVTTRDLHGVPNREIALSVRLDPPGAAKGAEWFSVTGWQGGGSVVDHLRRTGPGTYSTTQPIPVYGNWKTTLRLQRGRAVLGLPIFLPRDTAIPAPETPAATHFTRTFVSDKKNLQREQKQGVPGWLTLTAYLAVLAFGLTLLAAVTLGLRRVERFHPEGSDVPPSEPPAPAAKRPVGGLTTPPGAAPA